MKIDLGFTPSLNTRNTPRSLRQFTVVICLALAAGVARAQTKTTFEVASIKPAAPLDRGALIAAIQNGETPRLGVRLDGGRAEYLYLTLQDLLSLAYGVKADQITGPDGLASQHFDIVAKVPDGASKDDVPKMLQALLEDRFKLALHRESKEHTVLALVVDAGGPKMKESPVTPPAIDAAAALKPGEKQVESPDGPIRMTPGKDAVSGTINMGAKGSQTISTDASKQSVRFEFSQLTMEALATQLTALLRATGAGAQEVKDMTGLKGNYQVAFSVSLADMRSDVRSVVQDKMAAPNPPAGEAGAAMPADAASDPPGSSSLVQSLKSLGLKLEPRKAMVEQLVIDHVEKTPTEN